MVKIEINGQLVEAREGDMLIDVADEAKISIPRFCYHKKLSIAANCRMCLVEVEGAWKPLPACATPVTDGMKVFTKSKKAVEAQKSVMEFLLINHPLDCPICDQGGECELQDVAMTYGDDVSKYTEEKRIVGDKNVGSLISTDMTRCIHCTRCVRFGQEVGGMMELGATGRSEWMSIGTYIEQSITSELSGNMIDLCPVGALTSKPFRYSARPWELKAHASIAGHDSIGSNMILHTKNNVVKRVVPAENEAVNEVWLSDRDRFAYEGIHSAERLTQPQIKVKGEWQAVDWQTALDFTAAKLKEAAIDSNSLAFLASENATLEELGLLGQLAEGLGTSGVTTRLRETDARALNTTIVRGLGVSLEAVEQLDSVLLVGSYLRKELPLLNLRVRKAQLAGAKILSVNPADFDFNFDLTTKAVALDFVAELAKLAKAVLEQAGHAASWAIGLQIESPHREMALALKNAKNARIMIGQLAQTHAEYSQIVKLAQIVADHTGAQLDVLPMQANSTAVDRLPLGRQQALVELFNGSKKAFVNLGLELDHDVAPSFTEAALDSLRSAEFVVQMTAFDSVLQREYADVLLPIGSYAETAGSFVNACGVKQTFKMAVEPVEEAKAAWKVLRVLGNLCELSGFDYVHAAEVSNGMTLSDASTDVGNVVVELSKTVPASLVVLSLYEMDALVRRSPSLQATPDADRLILTV